MNRVSFGRLICMQLIELQKYEQRRVKNWLFIYKNLEKNRKILSIRSLKLSDNFKNLCYKIWPSGSFPDLQEIDRSAESYMVDLNLSFWLILKF